MYDNAYETIRAEVLSRMDVGCEVSDESIRAAIDDAVGEYCRNTYLPLDARQQIYNEVFYELRQLDIIQELIEDPEITEIMVNGPDAIFLEKNGRIERWDRSFSRADKLDNIIQQIVGYCNRVVNEASPIVDARLPDGSRVNVVLKPIALNGPILTIRRFPRKRMEMEDLINNGAITAEAAEFLKILVRSKYNIFISGGTGSGKTTFLNILSDFIPADERIITIEDSAELSITGIPNLVSLETRNSNASGCEPIDIRSLIKSSLRMRPDRIIVGEIRGSEAIDMLQAMNTGHDGSLSTGHANSPEDMLSRIETMVLMGMELPLEAVERQIASGIDIIVHLGRMRDRSRKIICIDEVMGYIDGRIVLRSIFDRRDGELVMVDQLEHRDKLVFAGYDKEVLDEKMD
ncbi:MAG: CpaF family protein [Lachnospiraceae bacterium]|nr:CpaF family protein [Lachnospiraceae bacterium]